MSRVLVMGPGHSGSRFLAKVLKEFGLQTIHEGSRRFRDGQYLEDCDWEGAASWLKELDNRALCGFPYGFMVYYLRHHVPDLKVICVYRPLDEWLAGYSGKGPLQKEDDTINGISLPRGCKTWEEYWKIYNALMDSVTAPILHLTMKNLDGCRARVLELLKSEDK